MQKLQPVCTVLCLKTKECPVKKQDFRAGQEKAFGKEGVCARERMGRVLKWILRFSICFSLLTSNSYTELTSVGLFLRHRANREQFLSAALSFLCLYEQQAAQDWGWILTGCICSA